jgi:hypothetical protein
VRTLTLLAAGALMLARPAVAQDRPAATAAPDGLALAASLAGGVEAGLDAGRSGLLELEALAGWEIPATAARAGLTIRPELALTLGTAPDNHVALRPGVRLSIPETPLWLRAAFDWSNARGQDPRWRWLLIGVAWEVRVTGFLGLALEADTGLPLSSQAGLPLVVRVGATFRP